MSLFDLWLPVLLSGVAVFLVSSIIHMCLHWHKGDYVKMPGEEDVLAAMRSAKLEPGQYMFPCPSSMKDMATPEMMAKYEKGPVGFMSVLPNGPPAMGGALLLWFLYSLLIAAFVGYTASIALPAGASYREVFRLTATVAVMGFAVGNLVDSIWKGVRWAVTLRFVVDGVLYGLATAGVFGWLWPEA
jgi:hypothetical protein